MFIHKVFAQAGEGSQGGAGGDAWGGINCLKDGVATLSCITPLFGLLVRAALLFSGGTALVFLIWGGIKFITSGGDPKQAGAARQTITYALIGLILILSSFFIINFLSYLTGVNCIGTKSTFGFDTCK